MKFKREFDFVNYKILSEKYKALLVWILEEGWMSSAHESLRCCIKARGIGILTHKGAIRV